MKRNDMKRLTMIAAILLATAFMTSCTKEKPKPEEPVTPASQQVTATQSTYSAGAAQKPRFMASLDGKVYVTCGYPPAILRIDTASGVIDRILSRRTNQILIISEHGFFVIPVVFSEIGFRFFQT